MGTVLNIRDTKMNEMLSQLSRCSVLWRTERHTNNLFRRINNIKRKKICLEFFTSQAIAREAWFAQ